MWMRLPLIRPLSQWFGTLLVYTAARGGDMPPRTGLRLLSRRSVVAAMALASLTGGIGHRFYNDPQSAIGTPASQAWYAPEGARVLNPEATQARQAAARTESVKVLRMDETVNQRASAELESLLKEGDRLRQILGADPYLDTAVLSSTSQRYLRALPDWEWLSVLEMARRLSQQQQLRSSASANATNPLLLRQLNQLNQQLSAQASPLQLHAASELSRLQLRAKAGNRRLSLFQVSQAIQQAQVRYRQAQEERSSLLQSAAYTQAFFDLSSEQWQQVRQAVQQAKRRLLAGGITQGLPPELQRGAVLAQLDGLADGPAREQAAALLLSVLEPNLVVDAEQTRLQAEQAANQVEPVYLSVLKGSLIVRAGQAISYEDFLVLDHFGLTQRRINWPGLAGLAMLVGGGLALFYTVQVRARPGMRARDHLLVLLLSLTVPVVAWSVDPAYTSLPAVGLLTGSFYGSALGATGVVLLASLLPIGIDVSPVGLLPALVGSLIAALSAGRLRSREELARLGVGIGLAQGGTYLILGLLIQGAGLSWALLGMHALSGVFWSIVALGVSPYLEQVFDLVTPIRLAELANPNRSVLKRLATEAPGTFQHTLYVATLAEAAARELSCNVELVRTGTLYHDIGKMHDPLCFIENQMGGPNKHDEINDPYESSRLIKKHVSEGLVMARRCQLPTAIRAFIPEHQGTMLIAYFYHQARERLAADPHLAAQLGPLQEADFRYDGPTPQSRETGLVMLADSCEAALRSLKDASDEEALGMVNKILKARWQDNQLVDSGLKREEMSRIAAVFVRVWRQHNHQRIRYPSACLPTSKA